MTSEYNHHSNVSDILDLVDQYLYQATLKMLRSDLSQREVDMPITSVDVYRLYEDWEKIRYKGWYNKWIKRLPSPLAFLARTVLRVVFLGHAYGKLSSLLKGLVDGSSSLEFRLMTLQSRLQAETQRQAAVIEGLQAETQRQAAVIEGLQAETQRQQEMVGLLLSYHRLHDYTLQIQDSPKKDVRGVSPGEVVDLIRDLERNTSSLARCRSVDFSVFGEEAEKVVLALSEHFEGRLSSQGEYYRSPNDLWICFLPPEEIDVGHLFNEANCRLMEGGIFILVCNSDMTFASKGWSVIKKRVMMVSGKEVIVTIMEKGSQNLPPDVQQ